jgi:hypothetical protein
VLFRKGWNWNGWVSLARSGAKLRGRIAAPLSAHKDRTRRLRLTESQHSKLRRSSTHPVSKADWKRRRDAGGPGWTSSEGSRAPHRKERREREAQRHLRQAAPGLRRQVVPERLGRPALHRVVKHARKPNSRPCFGGSHSAARESTSVVSIVSRPQHLETISRAKGRRRRHSWRRSRSMYNCMCSRPLRGSGRDSGA